MVGTVSEQGYDRARAAVLFIAPVVLMAGILLHPFVGNYLETDVVATAVSGAPNQWIVSHLIIPIGMALLLLAVVVICAEFRRVGERRWSVIALPLLFLGGAVWGAIAALEITHAAVVHSGGDVLAVMETNAAWIGPYLLGGALLFVLGWISLAVAFYRVPILPRALNWLAIGALALIVMASSIPQTLGTYGLGIGALVVSWLVGYRIMTALEPVESAAYVAPGEQA